MDTYYDVDLRLNVPVAMRDGVCLSTDIYLPRAEGPFPVVLIRTPYSNNVEDLIRKGRQWANRGYVCVAQDVRGRWDSDGEYRPFFDEAEDGYDTQQWIGAQPWCNGRIGMSGGSYLAAVQWLSAPLRSEYLKCLVPRVMCNNYFQELVFPGGAFHLNVAATWGMRTRARTAQSIDFHNWTEAFHTLPLTAMAEHLGDDVGFWSEWLDHPLEDAYWEPLDVTKQFDQIDVPVLEMTGWYDLYQRRAFDNFNGLRQSGQTAEARNPKLIVGPWPHLLNQCTCTGEVDFGARSLLDLDAIENEWFDYWLKEDSNSALDAAPLRLFIMGSNQWRNEQEWPLARTEWQDWYFHSAGNANTAIGDGTLSRQQPADEPPDHYIYDPRFPVRTLGGANCCSPHVVPWGPYDQRQIEMRSDVLCFTSPPLKDAVEVTGPIRVILYAQSDAPDTDWTAKLVDVRPDGCALNLCDFILRARYRESFTQPSLIVPATVYEYTIEVGNTANLFQPGHRIRVEISSSNFPRFDRNPNTGHAIGQDAELQAARQTIYHSPEYPSRMVLPVIPTPAH